MENPSETKIERSEPLSNVRHIELFRGERVIIDESDFERVSRYKWHLNDGYARAWVNGGHVFLHVFLLGRAPAGYHIDHINRDKFDNRRGNLRIVTARENLLNRRSYRGSANPNFGRRRPQSEREAVSRKLSHPVAQFDLNGNLVCEWPSITAAKRATGISDKSIALAVRGFRDSAGGFIWKPNHQTQTAETSNAK